MNFYAIHSFVYVRSQGYCDYGVHVGHTNNLNVPVQDLTYVIMYLSYLNMQETQVYL